jgi:hypothetical protein
VTTVFKEKESCRVCGTVSEHFRFGSINSFGSPDLDTRPPQMIRSTLKFQIRRCTMCGYCAPDLADASTQVFEIVKMDFYQTQLFHPEFSVLVNNFLCHSIIQRALGALDEAGWSSVRAAWVCDDEQVPHAARQCRAQAIRLFQLCQRTGVSFASDPGVEEAVLADLYRRIGQFEQVHPLCQQGIAKNPSDTIYQMLNFQIALAKQQDPVCHVIAEALP